jgi:phage shock protein C
MTLTDELAKLQALREGGVLTEDEFTRAKARLLDDERRPGAPNIPALNALTALRRSRADRWIAGVCGGIARMTGIDAWLWRLAIAILTLFGGVGLLVYALLWIFVPEE